MLINGLADNEVKSAGLLFIKHKEEIRWDLLFGIYRNIMEQ